MNLHWKKPPIFVFLADFQKKDETRRSKAAKPKTKKEEGVISTTTTTPTGSQQQQMKKVSHTNTLERREKIRAARAAVSCQVTITPFSSHSASVYSLIHLPLLSPSFFKRPSLLPIHRTHPFLF